MTDSRPQTIAIRGSSERAPRVTNQAIALERAECHVAPSQRISNEIEVQIDFRIVGCPQEFFGRHDSHGDTTWKVRLGGLPGQRSHIYPIDVKASVPLEH